MNDDSHFIKKSEVLEGKTQCNGCLVSGYICGNMIVWFPCPFAAPFLSHRTSTEGLAHGECRCTHTESGWGWIF